MQPGGNFLTCHLPGPKRCYEELDLNELLTVWSVGCMRNTEKESKLRDVISTAEPVCSFSVALANKRRVEEEKNSTPREGKTTQTMIGSSLTKHLSDKDR